MKLHLAPPCLIKYTDALPENTGGSAKTCYVKIRPRYQDDKGIHGHEIQGHVAEWWAVSIVSSLVLAALAWLAVRYLGLSCGVFILALIGPAIQPLLYRSCPPYRLWSELRAYRIQLRHPPATSDPERYRKLYAGYIANEYGLTVSAGEAERRLK